MQGILIVEDDRDLARVIARFLEASGFAARVAGSAEEAYDVLTGSVFDCLVADVNLLGDDGFALCRSLRERSGVPVLFASARIEPDARVRALQEGGSVIAEHADAALAEVQDALRAAAQVRDASMAFGFALLAMVALIAVPGVVVSHLRNRPSYSNASTAARVQLNTLAPGLACSSQRIWLSARVAAFWCAMLSQA